MRRNAQRLVALASLPKIAPFKTPQRCPRLSLVRPQSLSGPPEISCRESQVHEFQIRSVKILGQELLTSSDSPGGNGCTNGHNQQEGQGRGRETGKHRIALAPAPE